MFAVDVVLAIVFMLLAAGVMPGGDEHRARAERDRALADVRWNASIDALVAAFRFGLASGAVAVRRFARRR